jgi:soluble cytochrome b562
MAHDTRDQILALIESHKQRLLSNAQLTSVDEPYLQAYENHVKDLERETGENLQRFYIHESAIKNYRSGRFCDKSYFLGQLDALLAYLKSAAEWPTDIVD